MSIATPVSALMAATLPVAVGTLLAGFPGMLTFLGFILSLSAIWLISREEGDHSHILTHLNELRVPLLAGLGFGTYFILVHNAAQESIYWTMLASRIGGVLVMVIFMFVQQKNWHVSGNAWPLIALNAFLSLQTGFISSPARSVGWMWLPCLVLSTLPQLCY